MPDQRLQRIRGLAFTAPVLIILPAVAVAMALTLAGCACCGGSKAGPADTGEAAVPTPEETTLTEVGQFAPDFSVETLDGGAFRLADQRGKVVLINWFATWCPPCREEMPHLQKRVWERFGDDGLVMVSVAREEKAGEVKPFVAKHRVAWPFALDPDRVAFARYAEAYIPRNHVVGRDGRIVFQSEGFDEEDFEAMIEVIAAELERGR